MTRAPVRARTFPVLSSHAVRWCRRGTVVQDLWGYEADCAPADTCEGVQCRCAPPVDRSRSWPARRFASRPAILPVCRRYTLYHIIYRFTIRLAVRERLRPRVAIDALLFLLSGCVLACPNAAQSPSRQLLPSNYAIALHQRLVTRFQSSVE